MVPWSLVAAVDVEGQLLPRYLREPDHLWLRELLLAYERFVGRRRRHLDEHLHAPLPVPVGRHRLRLARRVLDRSWSTVAPAGLPPQEVRAAIFSAAADGDPRGTVLDRVAKTMSTSRRQLEEALFADLPSERRLGPRPEDLSAGELALRVNLALAQSLVARTRQVRVALEGNARTIVRQAKWGGLLCDVRGRSGHDPVVLEISGPLSLFRRTRVYGRALAALVPQLGWCTRFRLEGDGEAHGKAFSFRIETGDPVFPAQPPRLFDSRLEARFAQDFRRAGPDWDVIREPEPVSCGDRLLFPDFLLRHRRQPYRRALLEIVGFWSPAYLERKLASLRRLEGHRLILCVDASSMESAQGEGFGDLPHRTHVIPFRKRVDPAAVLKVLEANG